MVNPEVNFRKFILHDRRARVFGGFAIVTIFILFILFKYFYPYPNMVRDSYVYMRPVVFSLDANSFPIGYSKVIQLFSSISRYVGWLVWFQYLFLEGACLLFYLTIIYFFQPTKAICILLFVFLFCNPLFFYTSNFVMSDTLFTALSITWVTQLIWIICRPRPYMIWFHALLLLAAFTIRYNALYYPIVASIAFLLSSLKLRVKIIAILLQFIVLGVFILYTQDRMEKLTGVRQFAPFGGWQLANNTLYAYGHVYQEKKEIVPVTFKQLDDMVRHYFDSAGHVESLLDYNADGPGFFYMVNNTSPLLQYMTLKYGRNITYQDFDKWGPAGATYSQYGSYLVHTYPMDYIRYFVWPNTLRYFYPPMEIFSMYTPYFLPPDQFGKMAVKLFDIKTLMVKESLINLRDILLWPYPLIFMLLNFFFVISFVGFCLFGGFRTENKTILYAILFIGLLWICNLAFSATASCVVLRYQLFIMIIEFSFALLLSDFIYHNGQWKEN